MFQDHEVALLFMSENGGHFSVPWLICLTEQVKNTLIDLLYYVQDKY